MWNVLILWIALSTWILTLEMFSELVICVPPVSLNGGFIMYANKDISTLPAIQWSLMHEATALSGYLKKLYNIQVLMNSFVKCIII
jgi:hypothetical protein